jgi:glycosyl transferase, family 25
MYKRLKESYTVTKDFNIIYINLDKRKDRNDSIINELEDFGKSKYIRLSATYNKKGYLGCAMSHIRVLEYAIKHNLENVVIFEDDFMFKRDKKTVYNEIISFINSGINWDVLLLAGNKGVKTPYNNYINRIKNSQTTSAYIVNKHYYHKLLNNFKDAYKKLEETDLKEIYSIDQHWKSLQETDNWFALKKFAGIQRASYSDIENRKVNYGI